MTVHAEPVEDESSTEGFIGEAVKGDDLDGGALVVAIAAGGVVLVSAGAGVAGGVAHDAVASLLGILRTSVGRVAGPGRPASFRGARATSDGRWAGRVPRTSAMAA